MTCQDMLYMPNHYLFLRVDLKCTWIFIESVAIEFYLVLEMFKYFCKFLVRQGRRKGGGGVRGVRTNPLWRSIIAEEKLLNKVPVVEIHQPKKNGDINPFFRPYVLSSVKITIVKNPWWFKILTTFYFCGKTASARNSHRKYPLHNSFPPNFRGRKLWFRTDGSLLIRVLRH